MTANTDLKHTPLHDLHNEYNAKMVAFAGWEMPVRYEAGIIAEHQQCRNAAVLFDVSHMGQVRIHGDQPGVALESIVPAGLIGLASGKSKYSFFTNDQGGIEDDLILTSADDHFFLVVNASRRDVDLAHLRSHLGDDVVEEITDHALIAVQGPLGVEVLAPHCPQARDLRFMESTLADVAGVPCRVSRLGYTGEDGFEISIPADATATLCRTLLADQRLQPAGLGARDSLRLEAGLCLYGNDIDAHSSPIEAQLQWAIPRRRRQEGGFPGAAVIQQQLSLGVDRKLVGISPTGRAPARQGTTVVNATGDSIGSVTSGGFGPTVNRPVAMGYVTSEYAQTGTKVELMIRNKAHEAEITALPFVTQRYYR